MAISGKYGRLTIAHRGEDEPVFILRALDKLAISAIELYKILSDSHRATVSKNIEKEIEVFRKWNEPRKTPD